MCTTFTMFTLTYTYQYIHIVGDIIICVSASIAPELLALSIFVLQNSVKCDLEVLYQVQVAPIGVTFSSM